MDLQLRGKRALITGSTAGIGFAVAAGLVREGASIIINGRSADVSRPRWSGCGAWPGPQARRTCWAWRPISPPPRERPALIGQVPDVDILVNNMGIFEPKPFEEISDADWLRFFETNVMSGVRLTRHYLAGMKRRNWGRIVFVSSESAVQIPSEMIHYGMTKTAQLAIARGVAETTAGTGVTVNAVLPGPTESEGVGTFVAELAKQQGIGRSEFEAEFFRSARPSSLLKRFATVEEVANMIVFVCSPLSSATNGAALRVDGGVVRAIV